MKGLKFKKGNRVKVKDNSRIENGKFAGRKGKVLKVERGLTYPYDVSFDDQTLASCPFLAIELELLKAG